MVATMHAISKFDEYEFTRSDPTGSEEWLKLHKRIVRMIKIWEPDADEDGVVPKYGKVVAQYDAGGDYVLLIDIHSAQSARKKLGGLWHLVDSHIGIVSFPKDYSTYNFVQLNNETSWWTPRQDDSGVEGFRIEGIQNLEQVGESELRFFWPVRGHMKLTVLPEPKWGLIHSWASNRFGLFLYSFRKSRLRFRRRVWLVRPSWRGFWGVMRRLYDLFVRYAHL